MTVLIVCVIIIVIGVIVRAVRASNRRQEVAGFQEYASAAAPAFPLEPGEVIRLTVAARDLRAARRLENDAVTDEYPSSFPLVACTSTRLVIQMSLSDRTTDLTGSFPPRIPDLRRRIGEQFSGAERAASSCEWRWEAITSILAEGDTVGVLWESERGSGAVMLTFMSPADQSRFVSTAVTAITDARTRVGILPAATQQLDGASTDYVFPGAQLICSECATIITLEDRFCTGCGTRVFRFAGAES
jgi:hypothetical protein